jgi:hypothetical protein
VASVGTVADNSNNNNKHKRFSYYLNGTITFAGTTIKHENIAKNNL